MVKIAGNPPSVGKTNIVSLSKSSAVLIQSSNAFLSLSCSFQNTALLSKSFICRHELIGEGPKPSEPSLFAGLLAACAATWGGVQCQPSVEQVWLFCVLLRHGT